MFLDFFFFFRECCTSPQLGLSYRDFPVKVPKAKAVLQQVLRVDPGLQWAWWEALIQIGQTGQNGNLCLYSFSYKTPHASTVFSGFSRKVCVHSGPVNFAGLECHRD